MAPLFFAFGHEEGPTRKFVGEAIDQKSLAANQVADVELERLRQNSGIRPKDKDLARMHVAFVIRISPQPNVAIAF